MLLDPNSPLTVPGNVFPEHRGFWRSACTWSRAGSNALGSKRIAGIRTEVINPRASLLVAREPANRTGAVLW